MSSGVDLNALRERLRATQAAGQTRPTDPNQDVVVDRNGTIHLGRAAVPAKEASVIPQDVFASGAPREAADAKIVRDKLPPGTYMETIGETRGWIYTISCEFGNEYIFFVYFNGRAYDVMLVSPELEGKLGAHDAHLFHNGRLCLGEKHGAGQPTLPEAYGRSVLWASGVSALQATGQFPFSINNG